MNLVCLIVVFFFENDLWKDFCKNMCVIKFFGNLKLCEIFFDFCFKGSIFEDLFKLVGVFEVFYCCLF